MNHYFMVGFSLDDTSADWSHRRQLSAGLSADTSNFSPWRHTAGNYGTLLW
ncbi:hypothetical protein CGRA01v4_08186 [Colletotrichum graminicola]|nr:hypothetical protein CGRA01v4_08186 [Colletotrichum graminicola]